LARPPDSKLII